MGEQGDTPYLCGHRSDVGFDPATYASKARRGSALAGSSSPFLRLAPSSRPQHRRRPPGLSPPSACLVADKEGATMSSETCSKSAARKRAAHPEFAEQAVQGIAGASTRFSGPRPHQGGTTWGAICCPASLPFPGPRAYSHNPQMLFILLLSFPSDHQGTIGHRTDPALNSLPLCGIMLLTDPLWYAGRIWPVEQTRACCPHPSTIATTAHTLRR
jgi:hypothetical protein